MVIGIAQSVLSQYSIGVGYSKLNTTPSTHASTYSPSTPSSYAINARFGIEANEAIVIETGITYAYRSNIWSDGIPETAVDRNELKVISFPFIIENVRWQEEYRSFHIPFVCNYQFHAGQTSAFRMGGGMQIGYVYDRTNTTRSTSGKIERWKSGNAIVGGIILDAQISHRMTEWFGVMVNAEYSYEFFPKEGKRDLEFRSFGVGAGLFVNMN